MLNRVPAGRVRAAWGLVFAWAFTIYLFVPFARRIVDALKKADLRWLIEPVVYLLIAAGLVAAVRAVRRAGSAGPRVSWTGLAVAGALFAAGTWHLRGNPEEALHLVEYGFLSLLAFRALSATHPNTASVIGSAVVAALFGIGDELIQWIVPTRAFDFRDIAINASGGMLMSLAIGAGLRPAFLQPGWPPASVRLLCRLGIALLLVLLACVSATPVRIAALARLLPPIGRIEEELIQYGHRIALPDGSIFFSRLDAATLPAVDRERGVELGAALRTAGRTLADYEAFLREHTAVRDPVLHEARVHLFRRDRYLDYARRSRRNEEKYRGNLWVALREHRFLATFLPATLSAAATPFPEDLLRDAERLGPPAETYVSPVSNQLVTRVSETTLQAALILPVAILLVVLSRQRRLT